VPICLPSVLLYFRVKNKNSSFSVYLLVLRKISSIVVEVRLFLSIKFRKKNFLFTERIRNPHDSLPLLIKTNDKVERNLKRDVILVDLQIKKRKLSFTAKTIISQTFYSYFSTLIFLNSNF